MRGMRLMGSWVLALFLTVMFLLIADQTLFPATPAKNVIFPLLAQNSGIALWEPTGRMVVGLADILAALLVFVPFTRRLGAILAFLICAGAIGAYLMWLTPGQVGAIPVEIGATDTDGGMLFDLTLALLAASALLIFIHPGKSKSAAGSGDTYYAKAH
ncbi:MAG: hypothetical protein ABI740_00470 [Alphaproteobacteria bacterium]